MVAFSLAVYLIKNHIQIDFKSLLKKGFPKKDNDFGLYCYTGKQGKGKTYTCMKFLINYKINYPECIILTNVKSFKLFDDTIYFDSISKLIDYVITHYKEQKFIILFDEIFTILEKQKAINKDILSFISQLRKRQIIFLTTAQEWAEVNITFRRYVRFQIDCNMFNVPIINRAFMFYKVNDGDNIKWNNDTQEFEAPTISGYIGKCDKRIIEIYDTFETIKVSN